MRSRRPRAAQPMPRKPFVLAVVVARGASKGLPGKNLLRLNRLPLIAHTILAAKRSARLDRLILSTDSPKIAKVGKRYGIEVPFLRPAELATDDAPIAPVLAHAVEWVEKDQGKPVDVVVLLQATSPFRRTEHIDAGLRMFFESGADSVVGLCETQHSPYWMRIIDKGCVKPLLPSRESKAIRRQDLPTIYQINGALYASRRRVVMEQGQILGKDVRGLIMDWEDSVDIDSDRDLLLAGTILRSQRKRRPASPRTVSRVGAGRIWEPQ
jgi:CMP-N,N'-diacetyllegionaminic acid synthase